LTEIWRVYFDHDSSRTALARALTRRGVDCLTSLAAGNDRAADDEQLAFATQENRVVLTSNQGDFAELHSRWLSAGKTHAGIVVMPQSMQIGERLRRLQGLQATVSFAQMRDHLVYLGNIPEA
jgi:hypothetical protein